jgi:hypothetical protein
MNFRIEEQRLLARWLLTLVLEARYTGEVDWLGQGVEFPMELPPYFGLTAPIR